MVLYPWSLNEISGVRCVSVMHAHPRTSLSTGITPNLFLTNFTGLPCPRIAHRRSPVRYCHNARVSHAATRPFPRPPVSALLPALAICTASQSWNAVRFNIYIETQRVSSVLMTNRVNNLTSFEVQLNNVVGTVGAETPGRGKTRVSVG